MRLPVPTAGRRRNGPVPLPAPVARRLVLERRCGSGYRSAVSFGAFSKTRDKCRYPDTQHAGVRRIRMGVSGIAERFRRIVQRAQCGGTQDHIQRPLARRHEGAQSANFVNRAKGAGCGLANNAGDRAGARATRQQPVDECLVYRFDSVFCLRESVRCRWVAKGLVGMSRLFRSKSCHVRRGRRFTTGCSRCCRMRVSKPSWSLYARPITGRTASCGRRRCRRPLALPPPRRRFVRIPERGS